MLQVITTDLAISLILTTFWEQAQEFNFVHQMVSHRAQTGHKTTLFPFLLFSLCLPLPLPAPLHLPPPLPFLSPHSLSAVRTGTTIVCWWTLMLVTTVMFPHASSSMLLWVYPSTNLDLYSICSSFIVDSVLFGFSRCLAQNWISSHSPVGFSYP